MFVTLLNLYSAKEGSIMSTVVFQKLVNEKKTNLSLSNYYFLNG